MVLSMRLFILLLWLPAAVLASSPRPPAAAIASAHPLATAAGYDILNKGGNAFDAAVAIAAALAVVEPESSGLGGGGFWLLHRASDGYEIMLDGRERAPLAASADMYLDKNGDVAQRLSLDGPLAAAIPGTPAALARIARRYGRLPLAQSLAPAIRLAREGYAVSAHYQAMAERRRDVLLTSDAGKVFLEDGFVPEPGFVLRQPQLADTLERIAAHGRDGFYTGETAKRLVQGVRAAGGIWTLDDLKKYKVVERPPVRGHYRGMTITSASPPSSGGVVLVEMFNLLAAGPALDKLTKSERDARIIEAMRLAYRDRARYLGDPDFVSMDIRKLISPAYAKTLLQEHVPHRGEAPRATGTDTTHFSVIDRDGNRAAVTLTLNTLFGSGFMPPGTGVVLNNEMDDFVAKPGVANTYGLVGNQANAIAPGKRPLSSMTPTFLETPDAVVVLGTPGGSRIISMVLLAALEFSEGRGSVRDWVALPRFHHQYLPDVVEYEPVAFDQDEIRKLVAQGYTLKLREAGYGNMQAVVWYKKANRVEAASDPRGEGSAGARQ